MNVNLSSALQSLSQQQLMSQTDDVKSQVQKMVLVLVSRDDTVAAVVVVALVVVVVTVVVDVWVEVMLSADVLFESSAAVC